MTPAKESTQAKELAGDVASKDPYVGLRAVAALRGLLDSLELLQVTNARKQGWSWHQIALRLGVTKQAVHQKYADRLEGDEEED